MLLKSIAPLVALTLSGSLWFAAPAAAAAAAEDEKYQPEVFRYLTFLVGLGVTPAPDVTEHYKTSGGTTRYEWEGARKTGYQGTLSLSCGRTMIEGGGIQFGTELAFATYNITPKTFSTGGASIANTSTSELHYRTTGLNLVAGWEYGLRNLEDLRTYITADIFGGGGLAWAENQRHVGAGAETAKGIGGYFEVGARVGAYLTEQRWVYGVNVSYAYGMGSVSMKFDTAGASSTLDLERSGFGVTGLVGYRF
jgi:hypothetical protein